MKIDLEGKEVQENLRNFLEMMVQRIAGERYDEEQLRRASAAGKPFIMEDVNEDRENNEEPETKKSDQ
jgi:hypothetical protein